MKRINILIANSFLKSFSIDFAVILSIKKAYNANIQIIGIRKDKGNTCNKNRRRKTINSMINSNCLNCAL